ncbi:hypothetical protein AX15_002561 [Amanita polypyramis BW_CC]|nr:hypothetical protein AX15_002561 [Amanita polypyramis BW_CC]
MGTPIQYFLQFSTSSFLWLIFLGRLNRNWVNYPGVQRDGWSSEIGLRLMGLGALTRHLCTSLSLLHLQLTFLELDEYHLQAQQEVSSRKWVGQSDSSPPLRC